VLILYASQSTLENVSLEEEKKGFFVGSKSRTIYPRGEIDWSELEIRGLGKGLIEVGGCCTVLGLNWTGVGLPGLRLKTSSLSFCRLEASEERAATFVGGLKYLNFHVST